MAAMHAEIDKFDRNDHSSSMAKWYHIFQFARNHRRVAVQSMEPRNWDIVGINVNEQIKIREKSKAQTRIKDSLQAAENDNFPEWVDVNVKEMSGTFKRTPDRSELSQDINEQLIVELYSK